MSTPTPTFTSSFAASSSSTSSSSSSDGTHSSSSFFSVDSTNPKPVIAFTSSFVPSSSSSSSSPAPPAQFTFGSSGLFASPSSSSSSSSSPPSSSSPAESGGDGETAHGASEEVAPEEESTAQYVPVVKLAEVETKSGEEDDVILYSQRCALYRFESSSSEWKERGKGDVKLLQNKHTQKVRFLMRQEKTLKICMNHLVPHGLELKPNAGSDRSWTWRCKDYAGEESEGKEETFAIRFKDSEIANEFKAKVEEAKAINAKTQ